MSNENKGVAGGVGVLDEVVRHMEATMPTPLDRRGESNRHPVHHAEMTADLRQAIRTVEAMADAAHNLYVAIEDGATCVNSLHEELGKQLRAFHGSGPAKNGSNK